MICPLLDLIFVVETVTSNNSFPEFENLILEISTTVSITSEDAIRQAFKKFRKRFFVFEDIILKSIHSPETPILKKVPKSMDKRKRKKKKRKLRKIINKHILISAE